MVERNEYVFYKGNSYQMPNIGLSPVEIFRQKQGTSRPISLSIGPRAVGISYPSRVASHVFHIGPARWEERTRGANSWQLLLVVFTLPDRIAKDILRTLQSNRRRSCPDQNSNRVLWEQRFACLSPTQFCPHTVICKIPYLDGFVPIMSSIPLQENANQLLESTKW